MPRVKQPALWANDNALYVYGGEIEPNGILVNGTYQNSTRLWPTSDVWKFDTGSEQWSKTQGTGTTVDVVANTEFVSAGSVQKGFALGGRVEQKPGDLSQAALPAIGAPERPYSVSPGMANFGLDTYAWTNQTRTPFGKLEKGSLLYMESPGEQGILVSLLGNEDDRQVSFRSVPSSTLTGVLSATPIPSTSTTSLQRSGSHKRQQQLEVHSLQPSRISVLWLSQLRMPLLIIYSYSAESPIPVNSPMARLRTTYTSYLYQASSG